MAPKIPKIRPNASGPSYTIACPSCGAAIGVRCFDARGVESNEPHARRVMIANATKGDSTP
jgi:hypothetical protein